MCQRVIKRAKRCIKCLFVADIVIKPVLLLIFSLFSSEVKNENAFSSESRNVLLFAAVVVGVVVVAAVVVVAVAVVVEETLQQLFS
jgi:hypothetical protein